MFLVQQALLFLLRPLSKYVAPIMVLSQLMLCQLRGYCFQLVGLHPSKQCSGRWRLFWLSGSCVWGPESSAYKLDIMACSVTTWTQTHKQHDAAEFCAHFLRHAKPSIFLGAWNARLAQSDAVRVVDIGTTLPLKLDGLDGRVRHRYMPCCILEVP